MELATRLGTNAMPAVFDLIRLLDVKILLDG